MKKTALLFWVLSVLSFWGIFFKLAPWIVSLLPQTSDWYKVFKVVVYVLVGYFGGIGIPIFFIVLGFIVWMQK